MFADISGFTRLSEQLAELGKAGAEELTVILNGTFEALLGVARAEGGDLVKFGGDALFLFFDGPDHAARCCRAAHGMRATLKSRGAMVTNRGRVLLRISMGVHSGPFLFVLAGERQRELFVLGEHATTVTAMESAADAGEILISPATAALLPPSWLGDPKDEGILLKRVSGAPSTGGRPIGGPVIPDAMPADWLDPFVPAAIRRRLVDGEHGAEHRRTTVSFVHVGGIDQTLRDRGPAVVAELLDRIVCAAVDAADEHGVSLLATDVAGGGIKLILTAGVPDAVEDGEGRMLSVGRSLIDAQLGLPVRVGVNSGHVFAGEVGAPWRRVYTVMGDAVNLSARLMAKAGHDELVASTVTLEHSATPFELTPLEPFMVKGKRHPQHASSVGHRIEGRGRDATAEVAFVGRVGERRQLLDGFEAAVAGSGRCAEVVGEAGIGKSRLVRELIESAGGVRTVRLTCEPFAVDRAYFMARVLLRTALRIPLDLHQHEAGELLTAWLAEHAPDWSPYAPLLAVAIDAEVPGTRVVDDLGTEFRATKLREAAAEVLLTAFGHPLLLVVEDSMWMDEASAALIAKALERVESMPWFGCFTTRDLSQGLSSRLGFPSTVLTLQPLDESLSEHLAASLTDAAAIPHSELQELVARAKGNPLFLLELAHARLELGSLDAIPASLEDLIAARIDRLSPNDRSLLRHAAVLGDRFAPRLFERTLGDVFPSPAWHRLGDFIVLDQGELRFGHDLVRRVAYAGLPFRRRRDLHLRIGRALVPRGVPDDARLGLLALHFDGSGDHAMAWRYNRMAAERARQNYATVEAAALFERAIHNAKAVADTVPRDELAGAYEAMADVALLAGRFDLCRDALRGARRLVSGQPLVSARLCRKEGKLCEKLGKHSAVVRWYRKGLDELDGLPPSQAVDAERAQLEVERASLLVMRQKFRECVRWCHRALEHAIASGDRKAEAHVYYLLEWALGELGDGDAARYRELAQPIYEELGDWLGLAVLLLNRGVDGFSGQRWREAEAFYNESRVAYQRGGDLVNYAHATHNLTELLVEQGRYDEAQVCSREARRIWRAAGFAMGLAAVSSALGRLEGRMGRTDEALALLREARERFVALEYTPFVAEADARIAEVLVFGHRDAEAIEVLDALGDDAASGGPPVVVLAMRMRAVCLARAGRPAEARDLLWQARVISDKEGVSWESALAALELARLPGVDPEEAAMLRDTAHVTLREMNVDVERVLPPM